MAKKKTQSSPVPEAGKKNTSLRLDDETLKALKIQAIEEGISVQKIVERLIGDYLKSGRKKDT